MLRLVLVSLLLAQSLQMVAQDCKMRIASGAASKKKFSNYIDLETSQLGLYLDHVDVDSCFISGDSLKAYCRLITNIPNEHPDSMSGNVYWLPDREIKVCVEKDRNKVKEIAHIITDKNGRFIVNETRSRRFHYVIFSNKRGASCFFEW